MLFTGITLHKVIFQEPGQDVMKNPLISSYTLTTGLNSSSIWQWYSKCIGIDQQANQDEKFHHFNVCDLQCYQNETVLSRFAEKAF